MRWSPSLMLVFAAGIVVVRQDPGIRQGCLSPPSSRLMIERR